MGQYSNLMLLADPSLEATPAFTRAVLLARATGARLHLAVPCYDPLVEELGRVNVPLQERLRKAYLRDRQEAAQRLTGLLQADGIAVHLDLLWDEPFLDAVLARAQELHPDLVIKDARHESRLQQLFLQPLDWQLLNRCPAPLWLVNPRARLLPSRVFAAVDSREDGDALNDQVVREALALAMQCDSEVMLAHVAIDTAGAPSTALFGEAGLVNAYTQLVSQDHERFEALARRHAVPPERQKVVAGPVALALVNMASDPEGDVLVIGAARRSAFERLLLGRTATDILEMTRCDVVVVNPAGIPSAVRNRPATARAAYA